MTAHLGGIALSVLLHAGLVALLLAWSATDWTRPLFVDLDLVDSADPAGGAGAIASSGDTPRPQAGAGAPARPSTRPPAPRGPAVAAAPAPTPVAPARMPVASVAPPSAPIAPSAPVPPPPQPPAEPVAPAAPAPLAAPAPPPLPATPTAPPARSDPAAGPTEARGGASRADGPAAAGGGASRSDAESGPGGAASSPLALAAPGSGGGSVPAEYGPYLRAFRQRVLESLIYPLAARRQGVGGTVELHVWLEPTGRVRDVKVARSSSHEMLDEAAVQTIRRLDPVPFPDSLPRRPLLIRLPLVFELR
jgi:TonB family protein